MKFTSVFLVFLVSLAYANAEKQFLPMNLRPLSQEMVDYINKLNTTWEASNHFIGESYSALRRKLGVLKSDPNEFKNFKKITPLKNIPESFDARTAWPECSEIISHIRDQGACGSCWAVSTAEAISDRVCISSNGKNKVLISDQDILSCCSFCGNKCEGGYPLKAWQFWSVNGIVSGGDYNTVDNCKPYEIEPCGPLANGTRLPCTNEDEYPSCKKQCQTSYSKNYHQDKHYGQNAYTIVGEKEIQTEIINNGPVVATFLVYNDFFLYKKGVYQKHSNVIEGGHAIKLIGWGVEDGQKYWLAVNSWNYGFGENGYFKILRGEDECGIESNASAGLARN